MRRSIDLAIAILSLPVVAPTMLVCIAAIKLTSPGPAVFRQTRVGRHEKEFVCLKLRPMHVHTRDAPSHETAESAVTPLGRTLRRLKIDELPQLWNILLGDMSFVGPRPCLPTQTAVIEARRALGVYAILPGITGLSQIANIDMSEPDRLAESDARYLATMSTATDLRIMVATFLGAGRGDRVRS